MEVCIIISRVLYLHFGGLFLNKIKYTVILFCAIGINFIISDHFKILKFKKLMFPFLPPFEMYSKV